MMSEGRGNVTGRQAWGLLPQVCVFYFVSYAAPLMTRGTNIDYRWNSFIVVCFRLLYDYTVPIDWLLDFNAFKRAPVLLVDGVTPRFKMAEAKFSHYYCYRLLNVTKDFFKNTETPKKKIWCSGDRLDTKRIYVGSEGFKSQFSFFSLVSQQIVRFSAYSCFCVPTHTLAPTVRCCCF